jgi:hypothetical protein
MQWLPLYRVTPRDLRGILRTQAEVFPYTFVIRAGPLDFMVLSFDTATPPVFDTAEIAARARLFENERGVANARWVPECHHDIASLEGVLALVVSGPEDVRAMDGQLYRDDYEQLAYTSGDRILLSRYGTWKAARLAFAELRLTPFAELQRYFGQPIPADELDDERARALAFYSVPIPSELRERERAYEESTSKRDRFEAALEIAGQWDASFNRERALEWLGRAMRAQPRQLEDAHIQAVREIAQRAIAIHQATLRDWLDARPERERRSTLGLVVSQELGAYASRRQATRPDYVADWLYR